MQNNLSLGLVLLIVSVSTTLNDEWTSFKYKYNKGYITEEEDMQRMSLWHWRRKFIDAHNEAADRGVHSYRVGMNQFGDMTKKEIIKLTMSGIRTKVIKTGAATEFTSFKQVGELPTEVDWRKQHVVTPVQNQLQCGSSYAFSATGSLEGQIALKTGNLTLLSVQNLLDCSTEQGNHGCYGGLMDNCYRYIKDNNGIDSNAVYPYQGISTGCRFVRAGVVGTVSGFVDIPSENEAAMQLAVATIGPVASAIDADGESYIFYKSGIYDNPRCRTTYPNQGMLVIGYGVYQGRDYWILKNTLGVQWGMQGYMWVARNEGNKCAVATVASYPVI